MGLFLLDNFIGTDGDKLVGSPNHDGEIGANWTACTGFGSSDGTITGNQVSSVGGAHLLYVSGSPAAADYSATVRCHVATWAGADVGVLVRVQAGLQQWYSLTLNPSNTNIRLYKSGSAQLGVLSSITLAAGDYNLTLSVTGSSTVTLTGYLQRVSDGQWLNSSGVFQSGQTSFLIATDSTSSITAAGHPGIWISNGTSSAGITIDRIEANDSTLPPLSSLNAGILSITSHTLSSASLLMTASSGGTSPYTYQLQRAPDSSGSPGTWVNEGSALTGQTSSATFTSSGLSTSTIYWYRVVITDAATTTVNSNQLSYVINIGLSLSASTAKSQNTSGATTDAINTTGSNLIIVSISWYNPASTPTLSDSKGNIWTALTRRNSTNQCNQIYYCVNPAIGSGHTFTVNGAGSYATIEVAAFSGAADIPLDQEGGAVNNGSVTTIQPGSLTPSKDNCLVVTGLNFSTGINPTINSGFSEVHFNYLGGAYIAGALGWLIQSSAAAVNPTWNWTSPGEAAVSMAVFKPYVFDTTAPVLSSPIGNATGATSATIGATTDEGNGTLYGVVTTSSTSPSAAQIKAGQTHTGATASFGGSTSISSTGAKTISATGLTALTIYYSHLMHEDLSSNQSNVVTSTLFTTSSGAALSASPSTVPKNHPGNITLTLTGTLTSWTGGTTFTVSGVTNVSKVSQNIINGTSATLVITTGNTTGNLTISDGSISTTITIATPTLSSSLSSINSNITVSITLTGTNTLWSSETASGLFSISGVSGVSIGTPTINSNTSVTVSITTGSSSGTLTITDNSTGSTTTLTVTSIISVLDSNIFYSPYNWRFSGSVYAQTNDTSAYIKTKFTGTSITLLLDTSINAGLSAGNYPKLYWVIDSVPYTSQLTSGQTTLSLASGLAAGTHSLMLMVTGLWWQGDRYNNSGSGESVVRITGFQLSSGAVTSAPTLFSKRMFSLWDSNGEGYEALAGGVSVSNQDASKSAMILMGWGLDCEVGNVSKAGQGYVAVGGGNVPSMSTAWSNYSSGNTRLVNGLLNPTPDYIFCAHGQNDSGVSDGTIQSTVQSLIAAWRVASGPNCNIILCSPTNLSKASAIQAGVTASLDSKAHWATTNVAIYTSGNEYTNTNHLSSYGHARWATAIEGDALQKIYSGSGNDTNSDEPDYFSY